MSSAYYINLRTEYYSLKAQIETVINRLTFASNYAHNACTSIEQNFLFDSCAADSNHLENNTNDLDNVISYLSCTIIECIDSKISSLNIDIERALQREEVQKQRANRRHSGATR